MRTGGIPISIGTIKFERFDALTSADRFEIGYGMEKPPRIAIPGAWYHVTLPELLAAWLKLS